jgi:hypothetical protein
MIQKDCIKNFIVLRDGCYLDDDGNPTATPDPTSGFCVENLEGLSVDNISAIAPEKLTSATQVVQEKLNFAAVIVENRLKAMLGARGIKLNANGKQYDACSVTNSNVIQQPFDKGLRISKKWMISPQSAIWVETIKIKADNDGTTTLKVTDIDGNVLWSQALTVQADIEHLVSVRRHFRKDIIFVTADATNISLFEWQCDESTGCKPCALKSEYLAIQGWTGNSVTNNGYLGVCVRLDCTDYDIICQFLDRVGLAVLYQLGVEILAEWISPNNRLNIIATHGAEWAMAKIEQWEQLSVIYLQNEMDAIKQIMMSDKYCYNCEGRINVVPLLP